MKNNQLFNGALLLFLFIVGALVFSNINHRFKSYKNSNLTVLSVIAEDKHTINYLTLSQILADEATSYIFIDLRPVASFESGHINGAVNMPFENLTEKQTKRFFKKNNKPVVFYSDAQSKTSLAFLLLTSIGYENIYMLPGNYETVVAYVTDSLSPAHYYYNEEKAKWDYARIMQSNVPDSEGIPTATPAIPQMIEIKTPTAGGC